MRVMQTGTLSGITGGTLLSAVSSPPIALSQDNLRTDNAMMWMSVEGDTGRTGGSVGVFWKGHFSRSGASFATIASPFIIRGGTSISGGTSNGLYLRALSPGVPFIRIAALATGAGSTQHGTSATSAISVKWALAVS